MNDLEQKMTDRELLELAAKAAGLDTLSFFALGDGMAEHNQSEGFYGPIWNPLKDDGDAFRLCVTLGMEMSASDAICGDVSAGVFGSDWVVEEFDILAEDPVKAKYVALRRAIVIAAVKGIRGRSEEDEGEDE